MYDLSPGPQGLGRLVFKDVLTFMTAGNVLKCILGHSKLI